MKHEIHDVEIWDSGEKSQEWAHNIQLFHQSEIIWVFVRIY